MSNVTVEVELDHGRVTPTGLQLLPEKAVALLTILRTKNSAADPLAPDPELARVKFFDDPVKPLEPEDWPEAFA
jgi:hypothetical protein